MTTWSHSSSKSLVVAASRARFAGGSCSNSESGRHERKQHTSASRPRPLPIEALGLMLVGISVLAIAMDIVLQRYILQGYGYYIFSRDRMSDEEGHFGHLFFDCQIPTRFGRKRLEIADGGWGADPLAPSL